MSKLELVHDKFYDSENMHELIEKLTSDDAKMTKTFCLLGAGSAQSDSYTEDLRLPLARY